MARTSTPSPPPLNIQPQEFLLLSFPSALVTLSPAQPAHRTVELVCVTYPHPSPTSQEPETDTLLLLRLGPTTIVSSPTAETAESAAAEAASSAQSIPLFPRARILHSPASRTFHFPDSEPPLSLTFPPSEQSADQSQLQRDVETLELLLRDYGVLHPSDDPLPLPASLEEPPAYSLPADPRGLLLVIDQSSGAVLGELDHPLLNTAQVSESPTLTQKGHEKDPVVISLPSTPPAGEEPEATHVRPAETEDEFELILQGATVLSRVIAGATSVLTGGIDYAAQLYVSRVPPAPGGPTHLSPSAQAAVRSVHQASDTAVRVTAKTTGVVHRFIDRAIDKAGEAASGLRGPVDPNAPPPPNTRWREVTRQGGKLLSRVLVGTDMLLTTVESSAQALVNSTTEGVSRGLEHRYGPEVGGASRRVSATVRNVGVVYVDARGVGHRALLKHAGVHAVKATIAGGTVSLDQEVLAMPGREEKGEAVKDVDVLVEVEVEAPDVGGSEVLPGSEKEGLRRREPWDQEEEGLPVYEEGKGYGTRTGKLIEIDQVD
ncbi:hypothetical protein CALVIDRAFT_560588 [Calocera viscosa TUFC12733]|uniref:Senescence domain-containing protein n=1 Tax=Calocera viscosa (strain TUFC12733) TaxID=1330018 RepID=A0A167R7B4_CALVF|nr:hypothetical protein CALVIDRAFT_560588 [Calocera viscosa TUFC12733]